MAVSLEKMKSIVLTSVLWLLASSAAAIVLSYIFGAITGLGKGADAVFAEVSIEKGEERKEIRDGKEKRIHLFSLHLYNEEKAMDLHATVERSTNSTGLLKEEHFRVVENDGIAFDHPRFIVQSLLYIKGLIDFAK